MRHFISTDAVLAVATGSIFAPILHFIVSPQGSALLLPVLGAAGAGIAGLVAYIFRRVTGDTVPVEVRAQVQHEVNKALTEAFKAFQAAKAEDTKSP